MMVGKRLEDSTTVVQESPGKRHPQTWRTDSQETASAAPAAWAGTRLAAGTVLGRYVLSLRLGAGGMGVVYLARDPELDRKVAIKVLRLSGIHDTDGPKRLLREAQAMAKLSHPNVVSVYDVGMSDVGVYIAMEFVDGSTLRHWIVETCPSAHELLAVCMGAGAGVAAAHNAGFVHRDLKPGNILIARSQGRAQAKVVDFGLARAAEASDSQLGSNALGDETQSLSSTSIDSAAIDILESPLTEDGLVVGTPAYMAPEQRAGGRPTPASDQFAFCVTVFEALFGSRPGASDSLPPTHYIASTKADISLRELVRPILMRGLARDPDDRYPSMLDLLDALAAVTRRKSRSTLFALIAGCSVTAIAVGVVVSGTNDPATAQANCEAAELRLGGVWDQEQKDKVQAGFMATQATFALDSWVRVERALDGYANRWATAYTDACIARRSGLQTHSAVDARMRCLDSRRSILKATVQILSTADAGTVTHAVRQVSSLPAIERCNDTETLLADVALPSDPTKANRVKEIRARIPQAIAHEHGGKLREAEQLADLLVSQAAAVQYPPLHAETLLVAGGIKHALADIDTALAFFKQAHELSVSAGHDELAAESATALVLLYVTSRFDPEAATQWSRHADTALSRRGEVGGLSTDLIRTRLKGYRGTLLRKRGRFTQAYEILKEALEEKRELLGNQHPQIALALEHLALTARELGRLDEACDLARESMRLWNSMGDNHPDVMSSLSVLATILESRGDLQEAESMYDQVLERAKNSAGGEHPIMVETLLNLARISGHRSDYDSALKLSREALKLALKVLPNQQDQIAYCHAHVGWMYEALHQPQEALRHFEKAMDKAVKAIGEKHDFTAAIQTSLGRTLADLGRLEEAEDTLDAALKTRMEVLGREHYEVGVSFRDFGLLREKQDRWREALTYHKLALDMFVKKFGKDDNRVYSARNNIARTALRLGRAEDAAIEYTKTLTATAENHRANPGTVAEARFGLARALVVLNRDQTQARQLAEQSLEHFRKAGPGFQSSVDEIELWAQQELGEEPIQAP